MNPVAKKPFEEAIEPEETVRDVKPGPGPAIGAAAPYAEEEQREIAQGLGRDNYHEALEKEAKPETGTT